MIQKKYFLIVKGTFDRPPILLDEYPNDDLIENAIVKLAGESARVEERYVIEGSEITRNQTRIEDI